MNWHQTYREALAAYLDASPAQIGLFWKGRVGLYALLEAFGIGFGDEVIVPAFTCVVVPNAVLYRGAKVVYSDIDPATFNLNPDLIIPKIRPTTKAIVVQSTFGLSAQMEKFQEIARQYGLILIDDATHSLGGHYGGKKNGTVLDAAFFSSQWNKPFSTGLGGMTFVKDREVADRVRAVEERAERPAAAVVRMLQAQYRVRRDVLRDWNYWPAVQFYRYLSQQGWITGSSQGQELESSAMPAQYLRGMSAFQARLGKRAIQGLDVEVERRRAVAQQYDHLFLELGLEPPAQPIDARHAFLKYPFFVRDRARFLELAVRHRIPLGDWMLSPIHPILSGFERWAYPYGQHPVGELVSRHVLNLPTDVRPKKIEQIRQFLRKNRSELLDLPALLAAFGQQ